MRLCLTKELGYKTMVEPSPNMYKVLTLIPCVGEWRSPVMTVMVNHHFRLNAGVATSKVTKGCLDHVKATDTSYLLATSLGILGTIINSSNPSTYSTKCKHPLLQKRKPFREMK